MEYLQQTGVKLPVEEAPEVVTPDVEASDS